MPDRTPELWKAPDVVLVPSTATSVDEIAPLAVQLSTRELKQVLQTYDAGAYEIGATYIWTKTMAGLKRQLGLLGVEFIAEMLDRPDIRSDAEIHEVLTDYEAVRLAEDLGMFGSSHALRLRHALEVLAHFADPPDDADVEGMTHEEAIGTLRTCIQTVLGHQTLGVAIELADFRGRLEAEVLRPDSSDVARLIESAYFFQRTVLRVLMAGVKAASGAQLENLLANVNTILPLLWPGLMDPDRFLVGRAYAEMHANGQSKAASGLRSALLKVHGFDYVPEDLRSQTFIEAAVKVIDAHFGWDNFQNEPAPMRALASLGSSIPSPAFPRCMTALLCVKTGNRYGVSWAAQPSADRMLDAVTTDRWQYFFDRCLPADDVLLRQLIDSDVAKRWIEAINSLDRAVAAQPSDPRSGPLFKATTEGKVTQVTRRASSMLSVLTP